jgi:hypothetical protein
MTAQVGRLSDGSGDNFHPDGKEISRYDCNILGQDMDYGLIS